MVEPVRVKVEFVAVGGDTKICTTSIAFEFNWYVDGSTSNTFVFNVVNSLFVSADHAETPVFLTFNLLVETSTSKVFKSIFKDIVFDLESFNNG